MHVKDYMLLGNEVLLRGVPLAKWPHACVLFLDLEFDSMQNIFKLVSGQTKDQHRGR